MCGVYHMAEGKNARKNYIVFEHWYPQILFIYVSKGE